MAKITILKATAVTTLVLLASFTGPVSAGGAMSYSTQQWYHEIEARLKRGDNHPWVSAVIKDINPGAREITIWHGPIPQANMSAHTMTFPVRNWSDLAAHQMGDRVQIQVGADGDLIQIVHIRGPQRKN